MGKKNANFQFWSVFLSALGCTFMMYGLNAFIASTYRRWFVAHYFSGLPGCG